MKIVCFDIETEALDEAQAIPFRPELNAPGNYKDPDKIKANIEEQEAKWREGWALDPRTARVLVIGTLIDHKGEQSLVIHDNPDERQLLIDWWKDVSAWMFSGAHMVGFNCMDFDLWVLYLRSLHFGVKVPTCIWSQNPRFYDSAIVDLMQLWNRGRSSRDRISLDMLALFLGLGRKTGNGKDFAALYHRDRNAAMAYLENDLRLTLGAYRRFFPEDSGPTSHGVPIACSSACEVVPPPDQ
jgi:hypothetical protein